MGLRDPKMEHVNTFSLVTKWAFPNPNRIGCFQEHCPSPHLNLSKSLIILGRMTLVMVVQVVSFAEHFQLLKHTLHHIATLQIDSGHASFHSTGCPSLEVYCAYLSI